MPIREVPLNYQRPRVDPQPFSELATREHQRSNDMRILRKWSPILDNLNIEGGEKRNIMVKYAEYHLTSENIPDPNPNSIFSKTENLILSIRILSEIKNKHVMIIDNPIVSIPNLFDELPTIRRAETHVVSCETTMTMIENYRYNGIRRNEDNYIETIQRNLSNEIINAINNSEHNVIAIYKMATLSSAITETTMRPRIFLSSRYVMWSDNRYENNFGDYNGSPLIRSQSKKSIIDDDDSQFEFGFDE